MSWYVISCSDNYDNPDKVFVVKAKSDKNAGLLADKLDHKYPNGYGFSYVKAQYISGHKWLNKI